MSTTFTLRLYPEHKELLSSLGSLYDYITRYAYILHDKDVAEPHYHAVIVTKSKHSVSQLAKALGIEERHVKELKGRTDVENLCAYLTHENHKDKHRYKRSDVQTNDAEWFDKSVKYSTGRLAKQQKAEAEIEAIEAFYIAIKNREVTSVRTAVRFALDNGIYATYRRSAYIIHSMINECKTENLNRSINDSYRAVEKINDYKELAYKATDCIVQQVCQNDSIILAERSRREAIEKEAGITNEIEKITEDWSLQK